MNNEDDWEYSINLPHTPLAVGVARGALRLILRAHGLGELLVTAELLASELVTNAHVHAPGPSCLRVKRSEKWLRLSVWDTSSEPPRVLNSALSSLVLLGFAVYHKPCLLVGNEVRFTVSSGESTHVWMRGVVGV